MFLNEVDKIQHGIYTNLIENGFLKGDRTGVGTIMLPGLTANYDISKMKMPIPSTKKVYNNSWMRENIMFISGSSRLKYLRDHKVGIWDSWFIPGTAVYDEPAPQTLSVQERIDLAVTLGHRDELKDAFELHQKTSKVMGGYHYTLLEKDGSVVEYNNFPGRFTVELSTLLTMLGVVEITYSGGGETISLKERLTRVSKNDSGKWQVINEVVESILYDKVSYEDSEMTQVTIYTGGKFKDITISPPKVITITKILDELKISAYPLLDADIGAGSYAPQWRHWQDTQLVPYGTDLTPWVKQGYEERGTVVGPDISEVVMHREIDQLQNAINTLRTNPDDRRIIVNAWNPGRTWQAALPPCHAFFEFISYPKTAGMIMDDLEEVGMLNSLRVAIAEDYGDHLLTSAEFENKYETDQEFFNYIKRFCEHKVVGVNTRLLSTVVLLRSWDVALGMPFNTSQYAALTHMVAHVTQHDSDRLIMIAGDTHLYVNALDGIKEQLSRESVEESSPVLVIKRKVAEIDDFIFEDLDIEGYLAHPPIKMAVAV